MSERLRQEWRKGTDVRDVLVRELAEGFYKLLERDGQRAFREERIAPTARERSKLIGHFNRLLGVQSTGADMGQDKSKSVIISDMGILAQIMGMDASDLEAFEDAVLKLFSSLESDVDDVKAVNERLLVMAHSVIEHRKQFAHLVPKEL